LIRVRTLFGFVRCRDFNIDRSREPFDIKIETGVTDLDGITAGQCFQGFRQLVGARHSSATDQCRYDPNPPFQCPFEFQAVKVGRIVKSPTPCAIGNVQPSGADQRHDDTALRQCLVDRRTEVVAWADAIDVPEHTILTPPSHEAVVHGDRVGGAIFSTVAQKNLRQHGSLPPTVSASLRTCMRSQAPGRAGCTALVLVG
jgi:hypothetical protein